MALQLGALREALIEAKVSPEKAAAAAEEVAAYENRLTGTETRLAGLDGRITVLTWAVGVNVAVSLATLAVVVKLLAQH